MHSYLPCNLRLELLIIQFTNICHPKLLRTLKLFTEKKQKWSKLKLLFLITHSMHMNHKIIFLKIHYILAYFTVVCEGLLLTVIHPSF